MSGAKKIFKKTGKVLLWILLVLLVLVIGVLIFINTSAGKKFVRNQAQKYLREKLKTRVDIGSVDYSLPQWVELKNVYVEDQKKDTLLYGGELRVDLNMFKLIRGNTDIEKIVFRNIAGNISRPANDSVFNYEFIVKAFTGNKSTTTNTDTAELKMTLKHVIFENVGLNFKDKFGGSDFSATIKNLDLTTNKFSPDRLNFGIDKLDANGVKFFMYTNAQSKLTPVKNTSADTSFVSPYQLFISANKINLKDVDVLIDNKVSGMYYANKVTTLSGTNALFSLIQSKGTADSLLLDSSTIVFSSPKTNPLSKNDTAVASPAAPWFFAAKQLDIKNTNIKFDDNNKPATAGLDFSHLDAKKLQLQFQVSVFQKTPLRLRYHNSHSAIKAASN